MIGCNLNDFGLDQHVFRARCKDPFLLELLVTLLFPARDNGCSQRGDGPVSSGCGVDQEDSVFGYQLGVLRELLGEAMTSIAR